LYSSSSFFPSDPTSPPTLPFSLLLVSNPFYIFSAPPSLPTLSYLLLASPPVYLSFCFSFSSYSFISSSSCFSLSFCSTFSSYFIFPTFFSSF
jgi:hypothetical protein